MESSINPQVFAVLWPGFLPIAGWAFCVVLVLVVARESRRRLLRLLLLWVLPPILLVTAYVMFLAMVVSHAPL